MRQAFSIALLLLGACTRLEPAPCSAGGQCGAVDGTIAEASAQGGGADGAAVEEGLPEEASSNVDAALSEASSDGLSQEASSRPDAAVPDGTSSADTGPGPDAPVEGAVGGGNNLIVNGDFSQGAAFWSVLTNGAAGGSNATVANGSLCITPAGNVVTVGWPAALTMAVSLAAGGSYFFSYTAWTTQSTATVQAKVGQVQTPYTADFQASDVVGTTAQSFLHAFTATAGDPAAGIAFNLLAAASGGNTNQVCFAGVSLVAM